MTPKTQELLDACKKAGYTKVTVLVRDKRVPLSMLIKSGSWFGDEPRPEDLPNSPINVICAYPKLPAGEHPELHGKHWPKIWGIIKKVGLVIGGRGQGMSESHNIHPSLAGLLTPGYYDLTET